MPQLIGGLTSYLTQHFVVALVWLAGAILAIVTWRQHPRVSRLTLIALAIFFVESGVSTYANLYLPFMLRDRGWTNSRLAVLYYPLASALLSVIQAAGWGLILAAIFARRD
jgi:hypothetical protein